MPISITAGISMPIRTTQDRKALVMHLHAFDRKTKQPRRHGGHIGCMALLALERMAFKLSDPDTGFCQASYEDIRRAMGRSRSAAIEAVGVLIRAGAIIRHHVTGNGPFGCVPNLWEFPDPREVFHRLFTAQRVRGTDPKLVTQDSNSFSPWRPKRDTRRSDEMLVAEVAPTAADVTMSEAAWQGAVDEALERAAARENRDEGSRGSTARGDTDGSPGRPTANGLGGSVCDEPVSSARGAGGEDGPVAPSARGPIPSAGQYGHARGLCRDGGRLPKANPPGQPLARPWWRGAG